VRDGVGRFDFPSLISPPSFKRGLFCFSFPIRHPSTSRVISPLKDSPTPSRENDFFLLFCVAKDQELFSRLAVSRWRENSIAATLLMFHGVLASILSFIRALCRITEPFPYRSLSRSFSTRVETASLVVRPLFIASIRRFPQGNFDHAAGQHDAIQMSVCDLAGSERFWKLRNGLISFLKALSSYCGRLVPCPLDLLAFFF